MAPNNQDSDVVERRASAVAEGSAVSQEIDKTAAPVHLPIVWRNVVLFLFLHVGAVYGLFLLMFQAQWATVLWG